ncbi:TonB-dependent receptor [Dissulfuribacter thermophilus]|uniref:TonB-dependent receptor n=1 Tax=Dissulfuribacter thermophilus TaxID=1156395 RepID=A0A1B9F5X6_9BACT|nr:TonB-dependent receptor [Dissulfuribacter thermophilus]OCC15339.1 TonB-dependent receptor [Dissulfuribacter thermophilus]
MVHVLLSLSFLFCLFQAIESPVAFGQDKINELPELIVTATKTLHTLEDTPIETTVISREDIDNSNALTVSDLLRYTPGLFIRAEDVPGISGWRSKIRGLDFNNGYGLILVDGQRIKGGGMGEYGYGLNQIPLDLIDHIEIVKGPGSVLYGSDAVAGVINIITKPIPKKPLLSASALYGTHETKIFNLTGGASINRGKAGFLMSLDREESDRSKYGAGDDDYERNHFFTKLTYLPTPDLTLGLTFKWEDRERIYADEKKTRLSPSIQWHLRNGGRLALSGYVYDWDFHHFTPGYTERRGDMYYRQGEVLYSQPLWDSHLITIGGEYLEEELDYNLAQKTIDTRSVLVQDEIEIELADRILSLTLGGRYDDHSVFGSEFNPRLAAMLTVNPSTRIRLLIGRSFKSPTIRQLYYKEPFRHSSYWYKSNPNLSPENSWGYSFGIEKTFMKKHALSLTVFRNDIDDMVARVETDETIDGLPVISYENINKAYTQGIELGLQTVLPFGLDLSINYTFLDTEDKNTHKELTYSPNNTLALRLGYQNKDCGLRLSIGTQFVDDMYKDRDNTKKTDDYWLTEAKIIKDLNSHLSLSLEVDNLFDTNYGEPERDWLGRTIFVSIKTNL